MGLAPGPYVTRRDNPPPASAPTDSSVWFVTGFTEQGPITPVMIESLAGYTANYGARVSYGLLYDALDVFFREGGGKAYVCRIVGPNPVLAAHTFLDGSSVSSLVATAKSFGVFGNNIQVAITHPDGTHFVLAISYNGVLVETSPSFTDQASAIAWATATSKYINLAVGSSILIPAAATASLSGGQGDHVNATETQWEAGLAKFTRDLGPGQVSAPGRTTDQAHIDLLAHAATNNRFALCDPADTPTVATLAAAAAAARTSGEFGSMWTPWAEAPGIVAGTFRPVPWSAVQAGIIARNDSAGDSPNIEAAGINGVARYVVALTQAGFTDIDRGTLNDAGVNVARILYGGPPRAYGERTLVNPAGDQSYIEIGSARLVMEITAKADVIAENYEFRQLDGRGHTFGEFAADLGAMLADYWTDDSLYGATQDEAFTVDVGAQVNTAATIEARQLNAQITLRITPGGETVQVYISKRPVTETVS